MASWETWKHIVSSHHDTGLSILSFKTIRALATATNSMGSKYAFLSACFHLNLPPIISVTKSHDNYVTKLPNVQCGNYFLIISIIV